MDMKTSQALDQLRQANYVKGIFHDIIHAPIIGRRNANHNRRRSKVSGRITVSGMEDNLADDSRLRCDRWDCLHLLASIA